MEASVVLLGRAHQKPVADGRERQSGWDTDGAMRTGEDDVGPPSLWVDIRGAERRGRIHDRHDIRHRTHEAEEVGDRVLHAGRRLGVHEDDCVHRRAIEHLGKQCGFKRFAGGHMQSHDILVTSLRDTGGAFPEVP